MNEERNPISTRTCNPREGRGAKFPNMKLTLLLARPNRRGARATHMVPAGVTFPSHGQTPRRTQRLSAGRRIFNVDTPPSIRGSPLLNLAGSQYIHRGCNN